MGICVYVSTATTTKSSGPFMIASHQNYLMSSSTESGVKVAVMEVQEVNLQEYHV